MPSALGLPGEDGGALAGGMAACAGAEVAVDTIPGTTADEPGARTVRAFGVASDSSPVVSTKGVFCSSTVVTTARTDPSGGAVGDGEAEPADSVLFGVQF